MAEIGATGAEPAQEFLGFVCGKCDQSFPVVGPLDPVKMPPEQPLTIGSRGPLHVTCPHCQHVADYPIDQLKRFRPS